MAGLLRVLLVAATLVAYQPVWHAGFIWDDDAYVTENPTLHDLDGLWRIWFQPGAVPQYYPLTHTVFWAEYHLWGLEPLGYHVVNVLLHTLAALLLAQLLLRLRIPGAWLAAFIFALHPVCVESVAWVTELKNVLSTSFYLASALAYWRFMQIGDVPGSTQLRWGWYLGALALFAAALLSKTVTCSLPAALLLLRWWQKGKLPSAEVLPVLPFFVLGAGLGFHTAWFEKHLLAAHEAESLTFGEHCVVAGKAVWFYAGKLLWPTNLAFIYPRWHIDTAVWWQWLFPAAAIAVALALWLARSRVGRGPLAALLFFVGTLAPALGFLNVYFMRYSFVADHFQYLASIGLITLAAAGISTQRSSSKSRARLVELVLCGTLLLTMGILTWRQATTYADVETFWRTTLAANPDCSMAHNNLGNVFLKRRQVDAAVAHFQRAVELEPSNSEAHDSLGTVLLQWHRTDEAMAHFQRALEFQPDQARTYYNLGTALLQKGQAEEAMTQFRKALERQPRFVNAHIGLGTALLQKGQLEEAIIHFQEAVRLEPDNVPAHNNLGTALLRAERFDEAIAQYQDTLKIRPGFADAYNGLRDVAWVLSTSPLPSVRNGATAVKISQQADRLSGGENPVIAGTLAAAYAEAGRFPDATATAQRALELATRQNNTALAHDLQMLLGLFQRGQAYRESDAGTAQEGGAGRR